MNEDKKKEKGEFYEGREKYFMDVDRMVNEGLGAGRVAKETGLIEHSKEFPNKESAVTKNGEQLHEGSRGE